MSCAFAFFYNGGGAWAEGVELKQACDVVTVWRMVVLNWAARRYLVTVGLHLPRLPTTYLHVWANPIGYQA